MNIGKVIFICSFIFVFPVMVYAGDMTLEQAEQKIENLQQENESLKEKLEEFEKQIKEYKEKIKERDLKETKERELDN